MTHLLELNDWQLSCFTSNGDCVYRQSAAAAEQDGGIVFGDIALGQSRTHPQKFNAQYLARLNTEALPQPIGPAHNHADLIYHQLKALKLDYQIESITIATPAHYSDEQLGLLLGIALEAGINVTGFVDNAFAHSTRTSGRYHLLDVGLNHAYLSELHVSNNLVKVVGATILERIGIISIVDAWLQVVASTFMQSSRFDPLHSAESEQQAFDQAFNWINSGLPDDPQITVSVDGVARKADITTTQLFAAIEQRLPKAQLLETENLILTPRAQSIPGVEVLLKDSLESVSLSQANFMALMQIQQQQAHGEPTRITQYQGAVTTDSAAVAARESNSSESTEPNKPPATHLLADHHAVPLTATALGAYFDEDGLLRPNADVIVNGAAPTSARLRCADQVLLPQQTWIAIRVDD